jgi:hypothetical protein
MRLHKIPNDYQLRGEKELVGLCHDLKIPQRNMALYERASIARCRRKNAPSKSYFEAYAQNYQL